MNLEAHTRQNGRREETSVSPRKRWNATSSRLVSGRSEDEFPGSQREARNSRFSPLDGGHPQNKAPQHCADLMSKFWCCLPWMEEHGPALEGRRRAQGWKATVRGLPLESGLGGIMLSTGSWGAQDSRIYRARVPGGVTRCPVCRPPPGMASSAASIGLTGHIHGSS